jgi:hypothetical protein
MLLRSRALRAAPDPPRHEFLCSGDPEAFVNLGRTFLGPEIGEARAAAARLAPTGTGRWS